MLACAYITDLHIHYQHIQAISSLAKDTSYCPQLLMRHVVIGGGIAGVCCVEELCRLRPDDSITLVSSSTVLKGIDSVIRITKTVEEVTIRERDLATLQRPNLQVLQAVVQSIDTQHKVVHVEPGGSLSYDRLCIACGARPKVLGFHHERIITLRDTQSVEDFAFRLASARRIAVVGNGGIALELVGAVRDVEVVWVMKHEHIGDAFFDADAAEFLLGELQHQQRQQQLQQQQQQQQQADRPPGDQQQQQQEASPAPHDHPEAQKVQRDHQQQQQQQQQQQDPQQQHQQQLGSLARPPGSSHAAAEHQVADGSTGTGTGSSSGGAGCVVSHAAGPKWVNSLPQGHLPANVRLERHALVVGASSTPQHSQQQPQQHAEQPGSTGQPPANGNNSSSSSDSWPLYLQLSSGDEVGVDLLIQAIGVEPSTDWLPGELQRAPDGGILVGANLESVSTPGVFAAGDCCSVDPAQQTPHWFQMRLWTQARLMGLHAAACMAGADEAELLNFSFELFTHVTRFLGRKVVLLGLYNGQKLQQQRREDVVMYSRVLDEGTPSATFMRVLLLRGKMQGAVLIGDTDLEETFENLILDGLDLSQYGPALLDPDIELDHVFD